MTQTVPLVIYRRGQRIVIGSAEIDGEQIRGEITNKEAIDLFSIKPRLAEFSLVAEPAIEAAAGKLAGLNIVADERVPPGDIRIVSTVDDLRRNEVRFETNPVSLLLEAGTLISPKEKGPNG